MKVFPNNQGFTLLEILLVVVIVGIMTVAGVSVINSQSIERVIMNQAKAFEQNLNFLCEKAVFENQAIGIALSQLGYQAYRYQRQSWQNIEVDELPQFNSEIRMDLIIDGLTQRLSEEGEGLPQIVCQADGSVNAFELRFAALGDDVNYFALNTSTPWVLDAEWRTQ